LQPDPNYLLSAAAVREKCGLVLAAAERGTTAHFRVAPENLAAVARQVAQVRVVVGCAGRIGRRDAAQWPLLGVPAVGWALS